VWRGLASVDRSSHPKRSIGLTASVAEASSFRVGDSIRPIMTRDQLSDVSITTADDFEHLLAEAVEKALGAEIDARGSWVFQTDTRPQDWELIVSELARGPPDKEE